MTNESPSLKKVIKLESMEVVISDLSIGFIIGMEDKSIADTFENIIKDASNLSEEQIKKLRRCEAEYLVKEIVSLTYGDDKKESSGDSKK